MTQPRWIELAWGDLGVAETPGPATPPASRATTPTSATPVGDDETAWCAAFLGACLERCRRRQHPLADGALLSRLGRAANEPRYGAIAVLSRSADPALGHVGFLVGETADRRHPARRQPGQAVTVEAFPRTRLLGLRWPPTLRIPRHLSSPTSASAIRDPSGRRHLRRALAHVLEMEGGSTDDPFDPGGPTNFGITLADYARDKGVDAHRRQPRPHSRPS